MNDSLEEKLKQLGEVEEYGFDWDKYIIKIGKGFQGNIKSLGILHDICKNELENYPIIQDIYMDKDILSLTLRMDPEGAKKLEQSLRGSNI